MSISKTQAAKLNAVDSAREFLARGGRLDYGTLAFDSSYPTGGESVSFGFTPAAVFIEPQAGYSFEYDHTNGKIKAFTPGKQLIVEEAVTVASNIGYLKHLPFYILSVDVTAGDTTGQASVIPTGETAATHQCAVTFTSGKLTFFATDAVTAVRVTYIPLHQTGPFSSANLVVDEVIAASASKTALANRAAAVQYVWDDTDGKLDGLEPVGEAPSATNKAVVDITNATPGTDIDFNAADNGNSIKVTYIKYGAFGAYQQLGDGDLTLASEAYNFTNNGYNYLAIPGLGTALVGEDGTTANVELRWAGPSGSVGAGIPVLDFKMNAWNTNEGTAIVTLAVPIILLNALDNYNALLEVGYGTDLSGLASVKYLAIG